MDTLSLNAQQIPKLIANGLNFSVVMALLITQNTFFSGAPILAHEQLVMANSAIVSPILHSSNLEQNISQEISIEQQKADFNTQINQKYKKGLIYDVDLGVKHIKLTKYYQGKPVRLNIVEINPQLNPSLKLTPALVSEKLGKKGTITTIAKQNNSLVAINGTFFKPQTGVPLGTLMINKKMYTGPVYDRVAMGIFDNSYDMARIQFDSRLISSDSEIKIDNLNQPRMLATYVIAYSNEWGQTAPASPKYGKQIAIKDNKIVKISTSPLEIPEGGYVIVGPAQQIEKIEKAKQVTLEIKTIPNWENVNHIISGGPYLVKNGQVFVDIAEQKLGSIGGRNPRSAIGYTADNHLIIIAVDGREENSVGITLTELANYMKSIGCINAMNLDGGGSTVLYVNGKVVNNPQIKGGIALSNALTVNKIN